jgi:hypothetical protein
VNFLGEIVSILSDERLNLFLLNDALWLVTKPTDIVIYDFPFEDFFRCEHPWQLPTDIIAVARVGAREDYAEFYAALEHAGIRLIHSPSDYIQCSELPHWYPLIADLTPRSICFTEMPSLNQITQEFDWPVFIKGARQTSKHQKSLSIIEDSEAFLRLQKQYANDPILHWQAVVCREYVPLRPVKGASDDTIPPSFEFRTFWWNGTCVGAGRYWFQAPPYDWTPQEKHAALALAKEAALRVDVPFLVVDVAQTIEGQWIVIECNDGQESGYAGISPFALWKNVVSLERN